MTNRMNITRVRTIAAFSLALIATASLASCSSNSGDSDSSSKPASLAGTWKQSNSHSSSDYQEAKISGHNIEIDWVTDNGDTKSLYWAGSYTLPTAAGDFSWVSKNDTAKTANALLASSDATKKFIYSAGVISYSVSAVGTTSTVKLAKK